MRAFNVLKYILKDMKIKKRVMIFFSLIIIIPLLTLSLISYVRFSNYATEMAVKSKMDSINSALRETVANIARNEELSDQIALNRYYQEAINPKVPIDDNITRFNQIKRTLQFLTSMVDENNVRCVAIVGLNGDEYISNGSAELINDFDYNNLFGKNNISNSRGDIKWVASKIDIFSLANVQGTKQYLYLVRGLYDLSSGYTPKLGTIFIQFKYDRFVSILKNVSEQKGEYSLLIADNGLILCSTENSDNVGDKLDMNMVNGLNSKEGHFFTDMRNQKYLVLYAKDKETGLTVIRYIPNRYILERSEEIRNFILIVMLICLLPAIILALIFSQSITSPIVKLKDSIERFGEGNLSLNIRNDRQDEIGKLQESFNKMSEDIRTLMENTKEHQKMRRKLELNILEYQINPHFLYNTLDSINWMAQKTSNTDIGEMVISLANYYRIGLNRGKELITVGEELEHAYNYLVISKINYNHCFDFIIDVEDLIKPYKTIKILLQPIIENSIKHGINKNGVDGLIEIKVRKENDIIIMKVIDNGKGIEPEMLENIRYQIENAMELDYQGRGIGLMNVNKRIKINYGEEYGINIESKVGIGTTVTLRITANV